MSKCESNVDELIVPGLVGIPGTVSSRLAEYRDWRGDVQADVSDLETCASNLEIQGLAITAIDFVNPCARYSEVSFELGDDAVHASFSVRSSVATQKQMLIDRLRCLTESLGGSVSTHGEYPGWEFMPQSPLRDLMVQVFTDQYGYAPKVEAIHAGLECGLFSAKLPGLDCVSFGPDLKEIHTFRESLSVSSVQRVYAMVVETLKRMH
mgnify:CR=1 FL=1